MMEKDKICWMIPSEETLCVFIRTVCGLSCTTQETRVEMVEKKAHHCSNLGGNPQDATPYSCGSSSEKIMF